MIHRVVICTPVYGKTSAASVTVGYLNALHQVGRLIPAQVTSYASFTNCDLVRARSRGVRVALDACATHLLFWDEDVTGDCAGALLGMLQADVDIIAAPYPRKSLPPNPVHRGAFVGMGFTLIKCSALERMWDHYYDELKFDDVLDGKLIRTVALFQLILTPLDEPRPHLALLPEDWSFCSRALALGLDIHLYPHTLSHVGEHEFTL